MLGGSKAGELRFCNDQHRSLYILSEAADSLPPQTIADAVVSLHQGACPKCGGPGPIDIQARHTIVSFLVMTQWKTETVPCCGKCGTKAKLGAALTNFFTGWWGFPWGILLTPVQIGRNLMGLRDKPIAGQPSRALERHVRMRLGQVVLEEQQRLAAGQTQ